MKIISLQHKIVITVISIVLFYAVFAIYSDMEKIKEFYQKIDIHYIIPIFPILIFSMFLRSLLQRFILDIMGIKISIKQSYLLFLAGLSMVITPAGSGQMIKSHFIQKKFGHPISKSLPLIFAERFYDFLAITIILSCTMIFNYSLVSLIMIIISSALLLILVLLIRSTKLSNLFKTIMKKIPIMNKLISNTNFEYSLNKIFKLDIICKALFLTMLVTLLEGFVIYIDFLAFHIDFGYLTSIQIYYTSILFGSLSFIPGGVGITEGSFVALLTQKHLTLGFATALIIFIRLTTIWFATAIGFMATRLLSILK